MNREAYPSGPGRWAGGAGTCASSRRSRTLREMTATFASNGNADIAILAGPVGKVTS